MSVPFGPCLNGDRHWHRRPVRGWMIRGEGSRCHEALDPQSGVPRFPRRISSYSLGRPRRLWAVDSSVESFDVEGRIRVVEGCVAKVGRCLLSSAKMFSLVFGQLFKSLKQSDPRPDQEVSLRVERVGLGIPSRPLVLNDP